MVTKRVAPAITPKGDVVDVEKYAELTAITSSIIGAAIEVYCTLGPGLLESAYEGCLCRELSLRQVPFERQRQLPVDYKGAKLDCGYRLDLLMRQQVVVELKAVDEITPVHQAQLMTYLRLGGWHIGLLINFNVEVLRQGICRRLWDVNPDVVKQYNALIAKQRSPNANQ
jgi:GxxExxY protein